jgi:ribosomal protein S18 acetylase RimI-like enzyme
VKIRIATPDDAATLFALALKTFVDAFGPDNRAEDMDAYTSVAFGEAQQRAELEDPSILTIFAEEDGQVIGYAQLRRTPGAPHGDLEVARFYVDRDHHGRGVAQLLMTALDDQARTLGATQIWLGVWERNFRAIAFYRKVGFVQRASQPFLLGSDLQTDWVMNRRL